MWLPSTETVSSLECSAALPHKGVEPNAMNFVLAVFFQERKLFDFSGDTVACPKLLTNGIFNNRNANQLVTCHIKYK